MDQAEDRRRPHELSYEELRERMRALVARNIAERGRALTEEEIRTQTRQLLAEARAERGYDLSPEECRRRFYAMVERLRNEPPWEPPPPSPKHEYALPPAETFVVRESGPGETQLDRIERRLAAVERMERQVEQRLAAVERDLADVRERMATRAEVEAVRGEIQMAIELITSVDQKVELLIIRVDGIERTLEHHDLRLLRIEHHLQLQ